MIIASAIKFYIREDSEYPIIWTGHRHSDIFEDMCYHGIQYMKPNSIQGFITDDNRFLDRTEAREYAINIGQLHPDDIPFNALYSEDLWPK